MFIQAKQIILEEGMIEGAIEVENRQFKNIMEASTFQGKVDIDYHEYRIIPGIIDLHIHGGGGYLVNYLGNTGQKEEIAHLSKFYACKGITGFLATISLWSQEKMCACMEGIRDELERNAICDGAKVLGLHLEAPFFNLQKSGAGFQNPEWIHEPNLEMAKAFVEAGKPYLKYALVAPELANAKEVIEYYLSQDIVVSMGHSNASYEQAVNGFHWGIQSVCHCGNAMSLIHQRNGGILAASLLSKNTYAEIICDFLHLSPEFIDLLIKNKGFDYLCMIGDCSELAGLPEGIYDTKPRSVYLDKDKKVWVYGSDVMCGSSQFVIDGIRNLVLQKGYALQDVVKMSSLNPAKLLKIDDKKGSIKKGKDADFIVVNDQFEIIATYVEGKKQYDIHDDIQQFINPQIMKLKRASKEE